MQTIQSPNPFPNPPKPKPNPTKQHRIPTQHPIFQKTQNTKPKKKKKSNKQTNIPITQKHNPTSKKFTKSQSLTNLSEENLRTYFTLCKNQQREREAKQKKTKTKKKKNPKFLVLLWESERIQKGQSNFYALLFFSLSLSHCVRKN